MIMNNIEYNYNILLDFLDDILKNLYYNNNITDNNIKLLCYIIYNQRKMASAANEEIDSMIFSILRNLHEDTDIVHVFSDKKNAKEEKNKRIEVGSYPNSELNEMIYALLLDKNHSIFEENF